MKIKINQRAFEIVEKIYSIIQIILILKLKTILGCTIIDDGIEKTGSIEAGLLISEICLGGLGKISVTPSNLYENSTIMQVSVTPLIPF